MANPLPLLTGVLLIALVACDRSPTGPGGPDQSNRTPDQVGELFELNTQTDVGGACENPVYQTARVEAISQRAIVVADTANPVDGFTRQDYESYAELFDEVVAPLAEHNFGSWTDVGGTGRVVLFFTKEVNRLTEDEDDGFVAGFFFARDLFGRERTPRSGVSDLAPCPHSNERELLYLLVPDPEGTFGQSYTADELRHLTVGTVTHELQHLINAARRLHIVPRQGEWSEETWLNEALSHTAEELLFYAATGLSPGQDLDPLGLDQSRRRAFNRYQRINFLRLGEFLEEPAANSPYDSEDALATRGASWSFLRYLTDRLQSSPSAFYRDLVDNESRGLANLAAEVGGLPTLFEGLGRWSVAMYADGRVDGLEERYSDLSWDHLAVWTYRGSGGAYPIDTHLVPPDGTVEAEVMGGGSAYFRFGVASGQTGAVELTVEDESLGEGSLVGDCDEQIRLEQTGEAEEISGAPGLVICIEAPAELSSSAQYVLVSTAATPEVEPSVSLTVRSENTVSAGRISPVVAGAYREEAPSAGEGLNQLRRDHGFDRFLRERERVELGPLVDEGLPGPSRALSAQEVSPPGAEAFRHTLLRVR